MGETLVTGRGRTTLVATAICFWLLLSCGPAVVRPPVVNMEVVSPVDLDADSGRFYSANRGLFDYDVQEPLDIVVMGSSHGGGVASYDLTYRSPKGGRVPATLLIPEGVGPFPGVVMLHGLPADRQAVLPVGSFMARAGAVVILIDAPFARPENAGRDAVTFTKRDRDEQIQLIVDLRRAVDVLVTRPEVDADRLAYLGISYGGAMGGLLAGVEDRLQAYVLVLGDGGLVTHSTGPEDWPHGDLFRLAEPQRAAWLAAMWPIEPLHYVGQAAPAALLFLSGTQDVLVPAADALRYQAAGSEPKTVLWYEAGHGLPPAAYEDALSWLEEYLAAGDLIQVATSFRPAAVVVDRLLLGWFALTGASLLYLIWDLARSRSASWGIGLSWALTGFAFGPLALAAYMLLYRRVLRASVAGGVLTLGQRAMGTTLWGVARNLSGAVLSLTVLQALPAVVRDALTVRLPLVVFFPLATGLLVYGCTQWAARADRTSGLASRHPVRSELATTVAFLLGAYPLVIWLGERWLAAWYGQEPDLSNPASWAVLILGTWSGAILSYPIHRWLLARGLVRWGPEVQA